MSTFCNGDLCDEPVCGDGVLLGGEQCDDDGEANSDFELDACRTDCALAGCGGGVSDEGDDTDGCVFGCVVAACGDGFAWADEEGYDDPNDVRHDRCTECIVDVCPHQSIIALDETGPGAITGNTCDNGDGLAAPECAGDSSACDYTVLFTAPETVSTILN